MCLFGPVPFLLTVYFEILLHQWQTWQTLLPQISMSRHYWQLFIPTNQWSTLTNFLTQVANVHTVRKCWVLKRSGPLKIKSQINLPCNITTWYIFVKGVDFAVNKDLSKTVYRPRVYSYNYAVMDKLWLNYSGYLIQVSAIQV